MEQAVAFFLAYGLGMMAAGYALRGYIGKEIKKIGEQIDAESRAAIARVEKELGRI